MSPKFNSELCDLDFWYKPLGHNNGREKLSGVVINYLISQLPTKLPLIV